MSVRCLERDYGYCYFHMYCQFYRVSSVGGAAKKLPPTHSSFLRHQPLSVREELTRGPGGTIRLDGSGPLSRMRFER